jgi:protein-S-isoprenylcysteine O-methyltransferase Ste14
MGLVGTCTAFLYLGKSFGVVAANRGLKVSGPYRLVRHPIYLTHTVTAVGFVLANFTPINLGILVALTVCQVLRLKAEERILTETGEYAAYAARVRWRLVPGLF